MQLAFSPSAAIPIRALPHNALLSRCCPRRLSSAACRSRGLRIPAVMSLITPADAHARKSAGWKHLDVRTEGEFANTRAPDSVNIPFMNRGSGGMTPNPAFLNTVAEKFNKTDKIIVSCASGMRSARACTALANAGYVNLVDMDGGMNAWSDDSSLPKE